MNIAAFTDGRIAALESDLAGIGARLDELRRVRASLADDEPKAVPEPKKRKPRTAAQTPSYRPILTASDQADANARKVAGVLASATIRFHSLAGMVHLSAKDLSAALNHDGWFAKDDDTQEWGLTPKGIAATKGGAA